ncbi:MAG TPA: TIR domain-containing protein [Ignavibacteria bacterium]|nr:TIR domain-containing protein [Ignavibacteria bacterium]
MKHKCYISFKYEDIMYKNTLQNILGNQIIDKSLNLRIDSDNEEYIMQIIREDFLSDSTVTIHLIGQFSAELDVSQDQTYIKRELQASLYNGFENTRNGILGLVLPEVYESIYQGEQICSNCSNNFNIVKIDDFTTIREFNSNYYLARKNCCWSNEDRYCILVKWDDFILNPQSYIQEAYNKRSSSIADQVKVYPK